MSAKGKEYKLAIRIAGIIDKSFSTSLTTANRDLEKTVNAMDKDFSRLDKGFGKVVSAGEKCFTAIAVTAGIAATAIGVAVADCTKEASKFEHQMADVTKYVNGLADAAGKVSDTLALDKDGNILNGKTYKENYRDIKSALLDLSTQIPMTAEEMTKLSAAAGQSGYGIDNLFQYDSNGKISGFLKDTAIMGTAMDISAEQAGDWSAKWEKAFNMTHGEIMVLADQINYLGANSATTAAEIAQVVNDAASLGQVAGIDVSTTAALADAMLATGVGSDKVATSVMRTITNLSKGEAATKAMKTQWEELGFTAEGVAMAMQEDSIGTLKEVFEAIGNLPDYKQVSALSTLFGQWAIEGDAKIVSNMKVFQDALDMVSDPSKYSGSMEREFTIKASTAENIDKMAGNAIQAMKINIGDSFLPIKKEYSQRFIGFINDITEKVTSFNNYLSGANGLSKWIKNAEAHFPTFQRKFKKFAQPVFSGIIDSGKWIMKHGKLITSVIAGIGGALAAYKLASTVTHITTALMSLSSLNPVTLGILGIVSAIGALVGAFAAYKQYEQGLIDQNLADHFGDITLSMEELQNVAEYIVSSESLGGVKKALEAFEDLDGISASMQDSITEIEKMNWKISIGMELTEEENEAYKQAIDTYVKSAQEYALQAQYAISINLEVAFSEDDLEGQDIVSKVNQFYKDSYDELSSLGTQLNEAVTDAFNDGLLDIKETKVIAEIQRKMAEIEESLAVGEFDAQLSVLEMEYAGGGSLTPESFMNLQEEIANQIAAASEAYRESYVKNYASIQAAYEAGGYLNDAEYQSALENLHAEYLANISSLQTKGVNFQLETIMNQYAEELDPAIREYMRQAQETIASYVENGESDWLERPALLWYGMLDELDSSSLDSTTRKAIGKLLEGMQPSVQQMEETRKKFEEMGMEIPESMRKGLSDFALLDVLSDSLLAENSLGSVAGEQIARSEFYESFYKDVIGKLDEKGYYFESGLIDGISNAASVSVSERLAAQEKNIRPVVEDVYSRTQDFIDECFGQGFQTTADIKIAFNPVNMVNHAFGYQKAQNFSFIDVDENADGGIIRNKELSWLAEKGPEAVIPLDGSRNAVSLWEKAGQLLGMRGRFDGLDLSGGGGTVMVSHHPVLNFYGGAPSKEDMLEALAIDQDKFDSMLDSYFKTHSRVSYG